MSITHTITNPTLGEVVCAVCKICSGKVWPPRALAAHELHHKTQGWRTCNDCGQTYQVMPDSKWQRCPACQSRRVKRAHSHSRAGGRPRGDNYKPRKRDKQAARARQPVREKRRKSR